MTEDTKSINPELDRYTVKAILDHLARNKSCITYGDLAKDIEKIRNKPMHALGLADVLGRIQDYCLVSRVPTLPALVVNQETESPGNMFIERYRENHPDAKEMEEAAVVHAAQKACMECESWKNLRKRVGLDEDTSAMDTK